MNPAWFLNDPPCYKSDIFGSLISVHRKDKRPFAANLICAPFMALILDIVSEETRHYGKGRYALYDPCRVAGIWFFETEYGTRGGCSLDKPVNQQQGER